MKITIFNKEAIGPMTILELDGSPDQRYSEYPEIAQCTDNELVVILKGNNISSPICALHKCSGEEYNDSWLRYWGYQGDTGRCRHCEYVVPDKIKAIIGLLKI